VARAKAAEHGRPTVALRTDLDESCDRGTRISSCTEYRVMNASRRLTLPTDDISVTSAGALRMEIAPAFQATIDGVRVPDEVWGRRQKPRMVLAFAVAAGGRIDRQDLIDSLWPDQVTEIDTTRAFAVILSVARKAIGAGPDTGRSLLLHPNEVELVLGPRDSTDVQDLEAIIAGLGSSLELAAVELQDAARALLPMMVRSPLAEFGRGLLAESLVDAFNRNVAVASRLLVERWQDLSLEGGAPAEVLTVAEMACASDCTDEAMAIAAMQLHAEARGKAAASRIFHQFNMARRSELGQAPSSRLADLHADIMIASR
jgi:DNA-binding SARP family transcriptional activator